MSLAPLRVCSVRLVPTPVCQPPLCVSSARLAHIQMSLVRPSVASAKWDPFLMLQGCLPACCVRLDFTILLLACLLVANAKIALTQIQRVYLLAGSIR